MDEKLINLKAPAFTLPSSEKKPISSRDYRGKLLVVFFYEKDGTSSSILETEAFKDKYWELVDENAAVLGISNDAMKSHHRFIETHDLPYPLLSDMKHEVAENYGVWLQKTMYGKQHWGMEQVTFVIDKDQIIRGILRNLKPHEHVEKSLEIIKDL
ncbi:MAG: peroxiredoxin [bacterium]|nr:peroxiredoxin [bacterium]